MNERRTLWLLALVVFGQILLVASQARSPERQGTLLERGWVQMVAPLAQLVSTASGFFGRIGERLATRRQLQDTNRSLQFEADRLGSERMRNFSLEQEVRRLREALEYRQTSEQPLHVADIVYADHLSWLQTLIVHLNSGQAQTNQPVVSVAGLVGRVVLVSGSYAKVQMITDRAASVGAMISRTRRQGVARGVGRGAMELDFVPLQAEVEVGDVVLTAGIDGIYPRGLPVGKVVSVEPGNDLFHRIRLRTEVDFGMLDQVFLLDPAGPPEELKEATPDAGR